MTIKQRHASVFTVSLALLCALYSMLPVPIVEAAPRTAVELQSAGSLYASATSEVYYYGFTKQGNSTLLKLSDRNSQQSTSQKSLCDGAVLYDNDAYGDLVLSSLTPYLKPAVRINVSYDSSAKNCVSVVALHSDWRPNLDPKKYKINVTPGVVLATTTSQRFEAKVTYDKQPANDVALRMTAYSGPSALDTCLVACQPGTNTSEDQVHTDSTGLAVFNASIDKGFQSINIVLYDNFGNQLYSVPKTSTEYHNYLLVRVNDRAARYFVAGAYGLLIVTIAVVYAFRRYLRQKSKL